MDSHKAAADHHTEICILHWQTHRRRELTERDLCFYDLDGEHKNRQTERKAQEIENELHYMLDFLGQNIEKRRNTDMRFVAGRIRCGDKCHPNKRIAGEFVGPSHLPVHRQAVKDSGQNHEDHGEKQYLDHVFLNGS